MTRLIKFGVLIFLSFSIPNKAYSNVIDLISTKGSARIFFIRNLYNNQITFFDECANLWLGRSNFDNNTDTFSRSTQSLLTYQGKDLVDVMDKNQWHFYKVDLDGNGRTDLIIDASYVVVVMDIDGRYECHMFSENRDSNTFKFLGVTFLHDSSSALLFKCARSESCTAISGEKTDTVVYKFNAFARYNSNISSIPVSKICYSYWQSYGLESDGAVCIEINKDGRCYLQNARYGTSFESVLDDRKLTSLLYLITYLDLKSKADVYSEGLDGATVGTFTVYFNDGAKKKITIYGYKPPVGLGYLSNAISIISKSLHWHVSKEHGDFECSNAWPGMPENAIICDCSW